MRLLLLVSLWWSEAPSLNERRGAQATKYRFPGIGYCLELSVLRGVPYQ